MKTINFIWDEGFKRKYKKVIKNNDELKAKFWYQLNMFINEPLNPKLKTHKLYGKLKGLWAFSVDFDCRVVFKFINKKDVLLIDIGKHNDVY